jgi:hypothetical protein
MTVDNLQNNCIHSVGYTIRKYKPYYTTFSLDENNQYAKLDCTKII